MFEKDCNTSSVVKDYKRLDEAYQACWDDANCNYIKNKTCDDEHDDTFALCEKNSTFDTKNPLFNESNCLYHIGIMKYIH